MKKKNQGFRVMDKELNRKISRLGGLRAHQLGLAHVFTTKEAREAGRKGGLARAKNFKAKK